MSTHPTHVMSDTTQRCTRCGRWALTMEMLAPCRGGVETGAVPRFEIDWFAINKGLSA